MQLPVRLVGETGSTNDDMKALAAAGEPEGAWLRADRQSAGKGRMGRAWLGEAGNLYASTLVRLTPQDPPAHSLALVLAVAVHDALSEFTGAGVLSLKWPNDIMAGNAKLAGMLLERAGDAVVLGVGINVASAPSLPDRRTACLRDLGVEAADAAHILERVAEHFAAWLARWRTYGLEPVARAWQERAHRPGTPLMVELPDGERISGTFEALDPQGALILRLADGAIRVMHAGDTFLL
ncbi:biotin--[acetyl-CoA-carboxylase] ligase [Sphingobium sp. DEHP117]|uniref:biotin--[acetyl-CoA-carboxylase] ligase n=1 Tax=Sphingobium sp. DEHP117 TaxID=2993436 RepID=UPI0027D6B213|nr:biotin--[acetyl-CoA-carboxylase] ligase [Sphingobium sp. DEHP117]MDQ4419992.1 biotin--[acetyl-CoA-carboxylase] ligase [Sphingobium sp. DEHP117]